jgi:hypothetical protein
VSLKIDLEKLGTAQAALLADMLGILSLALVNLGTELSAAFSITIHNLGKLWMPGAEGLGPYSGKETVALVVWLVSWFLLHVWLGTRQWNHQVVVIIFLAGMGVATTLLWPPVTQWVVGLILKG